LTRLHEFAFCEKGKKAEWYRDTFASATRFMKAWIRLLRLFDFGQKEIGVVGNGSLEAKGAVAPFGRG
jgi:hypothetical protein